MIKNIFELNIKDNREIANFVFDRKYKTLMVKYVFWISMFSLAASAMYIGPPASNFFIYIMVGVYILMCLFIMMKSFSLKRLDMKFQDLKSTKYDLSFGEEITIKTERTSLKKKWEEVSDIEHSKNFIIMFFDDGKVLPISIRAFGSQEAFANFAQLLNSKGVLED